MARPAAGAGRKGRQLAFGYRCDESSGSLIAAGAPQLPVAKTTFCPPRSYRGRALQSPEESWLDQRFNCSVSRGLGKSEGEDQAEDAMGEGMNDSHRVGVEILYEG